MATYFDPEDSAHRARLHPDVRDHDELEFVIDQVEEDILEVFTVHYGNASGDFFALETSGDAVIALSGYDSTLADAEDDFIDAFRRTIAEVVNHRLRYQSEKLGYKSESIGDYSYERGPGFDPEWPDAWMRRLVDFDLRTPLYRI